MAYSFIRYETQDGVARITLARPEVLNAITFDMALEVQDALGTAAADDAVRTVLLSGAGRGFCSGQDLSSVPIESGASLTQIGDTVREQYNPIIRGIRTMPKPVLCAVNGVAAGAGANLALACDVVLASSDAYFIQAFTKIGLIPDSGGTFILPRLTGMARASALMLLGDKISATQARDWGLIWEVCEPGTLQETAMALARHLATQPTRALGLIKRALAASLHNDLEAQLELEAKLQSEAGTTDDFLEGVQAFREKRKPQFKGK